MLYQTRPMSMFRVNGLTCLTWIYYGSSGQEASQIGQHHFENHGRITILCTRLSFHIQYVTLKGLQAKFYGSPHWILLFILTFPILSQWAGYTARLIAKNMRHTVDSQSSINVDTNMSLIFPSWMNPILKSACFLFLEGC